MLSISKSFRICLIKCFFFKRKVVLFKSFDGQYNDNPKYISEKLHELQPRIRIEWIITQKSKEIIPSYVKRVPLGGVRYWFSILTCKVIVDNYSGIISQKSNKLLPILFRGQGLLLNISTWHGVPLKRIGIDIPNINETHYISTSTVLISGNTYAKEVFKRAFNPIPQRIMGYPRNDILVKGDCNRNVLRNKLNIPVEKKVVIYAPTFRDSVFWSGIYQISDIDIDRLLDAFSYRFGGDWVFVFRVHHSVLKEIDSNSIIKKYGDRVIDGNSCDDMAEYLAISDALITDYSGSLFDYALTNNPCFLYVPDKEYYLNKERGAYLSLEDLPYTYAVDSENLYSIILNYNEDISLKKRKQFLERIGNADDGCSSERIANWIISYLS